MDDLDVSLPRPRRNIRRLVGTLGLILLAAGCVTAKGPLPPPLMAGEHFKPLSSHRGLSLGDVTAAAKSALEASIAAPIADQEPAPAWDAPARATSYSVLPDVKISKDVEQRLARVADRYHRRTGKPLVITSGTRDPAAQAQAMFRLFSLGTDVVGLYKNKPAAREIRSVYLRGMSKQDSEAIIVGAMTAAIHRQIGRGIYISAHLRAGAVDVRNRNMTVAERRAFKSCVAHAGGISLLEESKPPHFHLQVK